MTRHNYERNQQQARLEAALEAQPDRPGPPRSAPLDFFTPDYQARFIRQGRVLNGRVYG